MSLIATKPNDAPRTTPGSQGGERRAAWDKAAGAWKHRGAAFLRELRTLRHGWTTRTK